MGLRIPQNKIQFKYTIGDEYIYVNSYKNYQGYYYEANGSFFAGKEFKVDAPILIKKNSNNINKLKLNPKTSKYADVSNVILLQDDFQQHVFVPTEEERKNKEAIRYFAKKNNTNPILIREVSKDSYNNLLKNPLLYSVVKIKSYIYGDALDGSGFHIFDSQELEKAKSIIPEIEIFLLG